jgi:predicted aspartyl protease
MQLKLVDDLPFATVALAYQNKTVEIDNVLINTGSATTVLAADQVAQIGLVPAPDDILFTIRGVGGAEVVFARRVDYLRLGERRLADFEVEVGGMDYGFEINGILGMDFLTRARAVIDLGKLTIRFTDQPILP